MSRLRAKISNIFDLTFRFQKAIRFVWESGPHWVIGNVILLLIQGLLPILALYLMKLLVDSVSAALAQPPEARAFEPVLNLLILTGAIALISAVVAQINDSFTRIQGQVVVDHMNNVLQKKGVDIDLQYYENSQYQDTLHRAQREAAYRPLVILNGLVGIVQNAVSLAGIGYLLFTFHWGVIPLLLIAVMPGVVERVYQSNVQYKLDRQITGHERRSTYYHFIMTSADFAKEVRIFGLGEVLRSRFQDLRFEIRKRKVNAEVRHAVMTSAAQIVSVVVIYGLFAYIAFRTLQGNQTLGDLVMYFQAFQRGEGFLRGLLHGVARLYENNLFLTNLYEFLDLNKRVVDPARPMALPKPIRDGLVLENVSFHYPNHEHMILKDINLKVKAGEVVALVGENGSGKTTLVKLLCRLYDPVGGTIKIDGTDIRDFISEELRQEIGVVFQDYAHYNLPARDNIWFGGVHRPNEMQSIINAARLSDIHDVLNGLNNGYDTVLGNVLDRGQELSIGQWQKVAIARAFFRNSQVLILDEPTSALDPKAEYELFLKFRDLLNGRTAILISHRLSTVRMADRIFVLRNGSIAESGTHDELMETAGTYARFFEQQAQNYR